MRSEIGLRRCAFVWVLLGVVGCNKTDATKQPEPVDATVAVIDAAAVPVDPVVDSLAFLATLDKLMSGFVPDLPASANDTDVLRCVTTHALASDPKLKAAGQSLVAKREKAQKAREKRLRYLAALSFRIDLDWRTKKNVVPDVGACAGYEDLTNDHDDCLQNTGGTWVIVVRGEPEGYLYSNDRVAPPVSPPELMVRMDSESIAIPARFSCRVEDVSDESMTTLVAGKVADVFTQQSRRFSIIDCEAPRGRDVVLRVSGEMPNVNTGDIVSLPLANTRRPEGVLLKTMGDEELRWTIDGDGSSLTIDKAAICPSVSDILSTAKK
jgi:hypothetical protein